MMHVSNTPVSFDTAADELLEYFSDNRWFVDSFWEENRDRLRMMMADVCRLVRPTDDGVQLLDVGCFNGFASFLFGRMGYRVTASDEVVLEERAELLARVDATFLQANFNHLDVFSEVPEGTYDIVIMGEVLEHVLNHPLGLMENVARVMRPEGLLVLTTPNPSTVMKALRILRNRGATRGASEFADMPKVDRNGRITSYGNIHYYEYFSNELDTLLTKAGFRVELSRYIPIGSGSKDHVLKRMIKANPLTKSVLNTRLFGATHYRLARKN